MSGWVIAYPGEENGSDVPVWEDRPPLLTGEQMGDEIEKRYGDWTYDDPEWWSDMLEAVRSNGVAWLDDLS